MGIRLPEMVVHAKQIIRQRSTLRKKQIDVPKGHFVVYVGEGNKKRFVIPIWYLNHPLFQDLLNRAEEEFGFEHPTGGLTIPCKEGLLKIPYCLRFYSTQKIAMGIRLLSMAQHAKQILKKQSLLTKNQLSPAANATTDVPKGHLAVYVGENEKKRFVVPISYLNHPSFQDLLSRAEEEFGFDHSMGGLTIPCKESAFIDFTSRLNAS
ncbi:hypothetical protein GIB67_007535 [Kingdonia uniflora]|uniref:Small auxin up regulated protein n=1 Tax=Kingdonia uniflora TaxID=39325 RepID=A0A7J7LNK3_9MAGN|nr:hypothetical protein GIB67_007535 [Kingdonia uniflora]